MSLQVKLELAIIAAIHILKKPIAIDRKTIEVQNEMIATAIERLERDLPSPLDA